MSGGKDSTAGSAAEQWRQLHREQLELRAAIYGTDDEEQQAELLAVYQQKRDAIKALELAEPDTSIEVIEVDDAGPDPVESDQLDGEDGDEDRIRDEDGPGPNDGATDEADPDALDDQARSPLVMAVAAVGLFICGVAVGYALAQRPDEGVGEVQATVSTPDDGVDLATATNDNPNPSDEATPVEPETLEPETDRAVSNDGVEVNDPIMIATLGRVGLNIDAIVPDQELASTIDAAITDVLGDRATTTVTVDELVPAEPWMTQLPSMVHQLPRLIEGSLTVGPDAMILAGTAPDQASIERLVEHLEGEDLPSLDVSGLAITDLEPSTLQVSAEDGIITLDGVLPRPDLRDRIVAAALAIDGINEVVDNITIDDNTYALLDAANFGDVMAAFTVDGSVEVSLLPGGFLARVQGLEFDSGGSQLTPRAVESLADLPTLLSRSTAEISIVGHTDSVGPPSGNQRLSERRATAVALFLVSNGIDSERITVTGMGESEPIAPNATGQGQIRNRRVMVAMSFDLG
ncbi:MAG: OmpA family protein [Actinomycetia bacterium]|nr:OmpA family protein [Actinomycetes bacterium]MCP5031116.1 OmpA family protein [Actinomycetes bacterium]